MNEDFVLKVGKMLTEASQAFFADIQEAEIDEFQRCTDEDVFVCLYLTLYVHRELNTTELLALKELLAAPQMAMIQAVMFRMGRLSVEKPSTFEYILTQLEETATLLEGMMRLKGEIQ